MSFTCSAFCTPFVRLHVNSHVCVPQEDFQAMTYGFKMANNVTDLRVTGISRTLRVGHFTLRVGQFAFQNNALRHLMTFQP